MAITQITLGFMNSGNDRIDLTKVTAILYTSTGATYKCIYYDDDDNVTTTVTNIPSKLPCALTNPVDDSGSPISYLDPGKYVEYSLKFDGSTITSSVLQVNSYVQISYSTCGEISERFPIS